MAPSSEKLSDIITNACISSNFPTSQLPRDFLPQGELEQIITQESITKELKCHDDDPLVDFILKNARKLFAICVMSFIQKLKPTMELFREHNISDNNLPVLISQAGSNSDIVQCFRECDLANRNNFMNTQQWSFLAPVFSVRLDSALAPVQYVEGIIFPFIETEEKMEGGFGTVYRVRIPESHLDGSSDDPILKDNCNAAIKELKASINMSQTNTLAYRAWRREAVALERIRNFRHPHVIETSAIFSKGRKQYFMFPWADGGNLWEFWEKYPSPDLTVDLIGGIMGQVTGLAHALKILHENNCRHGDLKPENILVFTSREQQGVWKMADMGLAKFHQDVTNERVNTTSNKFGGTISYEPPEVASRIGPRSRLYDTWCVGCITLQLVIWLLCGLEGHKNFTKSLYDTERGHSSFWTNRIEPQVHPEVAKIMDNLSGLLENETKSPALEALLHIVRSKLLVAQITSRATADVFYSEMKEIQDKGQQDKKYWLEYQLRSNSSTFTSPPEAPNSMDEDGQAGYSNEYSHPPLNELWDFPTDNDFAGKFFSNSEVLESFASSASAASFCGKCREMKFWAQSFQIRDNLLDLKNQAVICDFCNLRWNLCKDTDLGKESTVFFDRLHSTLRLNKGFPPVLTLHRGPDLKSEAADHMCKLQIGFPQLPVAGSGAYFELLRQWMRDCDTTHTNCESPNIFSFPTRLIDVGTSGSPVLRLYETQQGDRMNYFALSHPWGKQPHFCTFPGNIDQFKKNINFDDLPTTFQHAVTVTRELQLRYLWIDSICIIQGPEGDFNEEAKRMEDIFSQAYCVLAASSAFGQSDGFIKPRKPRKCLPFQQDGQNIYVCEFIDDFNQHVLKSPLSQRGWVLQERVLARRTIYFTDTQTYWECGGGVRCETMMKMQNKLVSFLGDPAFPKVAIQTRRGGKIILYQYLYSQYSRLAFTRQEDRPVAISGLEKRLIHSFRVSGGFGILDDAKHGLLHRSLLWHRARDSVRLEKINFKGVNSIAPSVSSPPSWSWMAYTGAIDYLDMEFGEVEWETEELHSPWSSSAMGTWSYSRDESGRNRELRVIARDLEVQSMELGKDGSIIYDDPTKLDELRATLKCVVLGKSKNQEKPISDRTHFVLLVTAEASQAARGYQVYSRVGVGSMPGSWISWEKSGTPGRVL